MTYVKHIGESFEDKQILYACFKLNNNDLIQTNCIDNATSSQTYIENIGLKYTKDN